MMLRVSTKVTGDDINLHTITEGAATNSGVNGQNELLALVEATLDDHASVQLPDIRRALAAKLDEASLVEAAAVIGNFQRMTRIADGTGIPLDAPVAALTADIRDDLGLNEYGSAAYTPSVGRVKRLLFRWLQPLFINRLRKQMNPES